MAADECGSGPGRVTLTREAALARMLAQIGPLQETEWVALDTALGRVLAEPVISTIDVPAWDNSAMDGYAVRQADLASSDGRLPVAQRIAAGAVGHALAPGTAARIFTGAPIPDGCDTVVIQEVCDLRDGWLHAPREVNLGANIRRRGEDIQSGTEVIAAGVRLAPQHLGLAASIGVAQMRVFRRLRVATLCSGDELILPGTPLGPGQIYNSNRFLLIGLLQRLGCEVIDLGIVEDNLSATREALLRAAADSDLVITSGGVSVGEEDHLKAALESAGTLELWSLAIRPGKPLAFGHIGTTPVIANPGNPVSLFVTFCLFANPVIERRQGIAGDPRPLSVRVRAGFDWPRPDKRREFHRARIEIAEDGAPELVVFPSRSSAVLSSVVWADGLVEIPEGRVITRGDWVDFIPFEGLLR